LFAALASTACFALRRSWTWPPPRSPRWRLPRHRCTPGQKVLKDIRKAVSDLGRAVRSRG